MTFGDELPVVERSDAISRLFAELPQGFELKYAKLLELQQALKNAMANTLQETLNHHLQSMPQQSAVEKHALAILVNDVLRSLNLAIKCPSTGLPGILVVDSIAGNPNAVRFRIQVKDGQNRRLRRSTSHDLPLPLELIGGPIREEALAGRQDRGTSRSR